MTAEGRRIRRLWASSLPLWITVVFLIAAPLAAEEEPVPPAEPEREILLAAVTTDLAGEAEGLAREARDALADGRAIAARNALLRLAERHGETFIPVALALDPDDPEADGALRWSAREVANLAIARLPEEERAVVAERWAADAAVLMEEARLRGGRDLRPLRRLARAFGALDSGRLALRLLARRLQADGHYAEAAVHLERWLQLSPEAPVEERVIVVAELTDALAALEDAGGVLALSERFASIANQKVRRAGRMVRLDDLFGRVPKRAKARRPKDPVAPVSLTTIWSRSIEAPELYRTEWTTPGAKQRAVTAGALVRGESIVLHGGRHVTRLDALTGVEAWRFPRRELPRRHAPDTRYMWQDIPVRSVTDAGDLVLVVLGDAGASGNYSFRDEIVDSSTLRDELRLRLAALDVETGELRWTTGRHDDTHPVLGSPAVGVASTPLVDGDRVYVTLASRIGTGTYYAACLERESGRALWVRKLGDGVSGRAPDRSNEDRFGQRYLHGLGFGARPSLAGGELCVLPHAGMAAGLDATDGDLRWVRALPRYSFATTHEAGTGPSSRNVAQAFGDAWICAPMDCPQLVCIKRGTGLLRWMQGPLMPHEQPIWRDLFHVGPDPEGRPAVYMSAFDGNVVFDARGVHAKPLNGVEPDEMLGGQTAVGARGVVHEGNAWRASMGRLLGTPFWPDAGDVVNDTMVELPSRAPLSGDLYRVGEAWLVVGVDRVALVADSSGAGDLVADSASGNGAAERARAAVRAVTRARIRARPGDVEAALDRLASVEDPTWHARAARRIGEELAVWLDGVWGLTDESGTHGQALRALKALTPGLWSLPPDERGPALYYAVQGWKALGRGQEAVELLDRWIREPGSRLMGADPLRADTVGELRILRRGDLLAAELLDLTRADHPSAMPALQRRERRHLEAVNAMLDAPEAALREAIRRAAGTEAAAVGRRRLIDRFEAAGRLADAAAVYADLRLDPAPRERKTPGRMLRGLARHQVKEAALLAQDGELDRARSLLVDAARWAPPGSRDSRGRPLAEGAAALQRAGGLRPRRRGFKDIDVWKVTGRAPTPSEVNSVHWTGVFGPGVDALGDTVLLVRGLTPELWSFETGERLAALPGEDEGWFGGRLQSVDVWLPGGGILVSSLVAGEPADKSKVRAGDWIRTWDGQPTPDLPTFIRAVANSEPGKWIDVGVWRGGKRFLESFQAGRRPLDQRPRRTDDAYSRLYVDANARILFPQRSGLDWVDTKARKRVRLWRWQGAGTILRADVNGGHAYCTIERPGFDDIIVAVDLATGKEVWQRRVHGDALRVQAAGSALWVDAAEPGWTWVLDRATGEVRSAVRTLTGRRDEYRRTWTEPFLADIAPAGRGFVVVGRRSQPEMLCINSTTGKAEWVVAVGGKVSRMNRGRSGYLNPHLSADAVVAVVDGADAIRIIIPDPTGAPPNESAGEVIVAGHNRIHTGDDTGGTLSDDARLIVKGRSIHMVRNLWNRVTCWTVDVEFDQLGPGRTGSPNDDPILMRANERMLADSPDGVRHQPYVIDVAADADGLYVVGVLFADAPWTEVRYASDQGSQRLLNATVLEAHRHRPMRYGKRLLVPTDRGARIFRMLPLAD